MPSSSRPGHRQVPGQRRPAGQDDGVEGGVHLGRRHDPDVGGAGRAGPALLPRLGRAVERGVVAAHLGRALEDDALGLELGQAAVQDGLLHFELGDAVAQEPARALGPLVDGHGVAGPGQLLGRGQAGRTRAHDGHRLAGAHRRQLRGDPALVPGPLDDLVLDPLDGHRQLVDPEHARRLARSRAEPPGELGEVVGGVQALHGVGPVVPVDEVVPLGDQVPEWAAVVAEGDAAVHAARALLLGRLLVEGLVDLAPVPQPDRHRPAPGQRAPELEEPGRLTHARPPSRPGPPSAPRPRPASSPRGCAGSPGA